MKIKLMIPLAVILAVSSILGGCGKKVQTQAEQIKNVKVVEAVNSKVSTEVEYASKLKPVSEVSVSSKTPGKVAAANFEVGQSVSKDDILFILDSKDIQAQLEQQRAGAELSKINLEKAKESGLEQQILTAEQALQRAQISYDNAKYNFENKQKLYDIQAISKSDYTDAESKLKSALTELSSAKDNLNLIKEKLGPQSIQSASAQVRQSEAAVTGSMIALDNTVVKAPIHGVVSIKNVKVGEMTSSSIPAYTIINTAEMLADINVSDKMIGKLQKDQKVTVKITALGNKSIEGVIDSVSPSADDKTQNYTVKVRINNADGALKSGMFAKVMLPAEVKENVLTVPKSTIKIENGISYVYIVDEEKVKKVPITTGIFNDKITEVTSNLKAGAFVITEGQIFLSEGEKVNIVK